MVFYGHYVTYSASLLILGLPSRSTYHFEAQMPAHIPETDILHFIINWRYHGNRNGREHEMLLHFEDIFGYHGNRVTKAIDFDVPLDRTPGKLLFNTTFFFLP